MLDREELLRLASLVGTDAKNPEEKLLEFVKAWGRKQRASELAKTCLAGMPELTSRQQRYIEKRLSKLQGGKDA